MRLIIYRYIHPHAMAAIAFAFSLLVMLFTAYNLKRMQVLKVLGRFALALNALATGFLALGDYYVWPCRDVLLIFTFMCLGLCILFPCCYGYRYGTEEQKISITQDLVMIAVPIAILLGVYLFTLWRRSS